MKTASDIRTLTKASFHRLGPLAVALFAALAGFEAAAVPIAPGELVAPKFEIVGGTLNFTVQPSVAGRSYQLQYSDTLEGGTWRDLGGAASGDGNNLVMTTPYPVGANKKPFWPPHPAAFLMRNFSRDSGCPKRSSLGARAFRARPSTRSSKAGGRSKPRWPTRLGCSSAWTRNFGST